MKNEKDFQNKTEQGKQSLTHKVGDAIETVGKKVTEAGAKKTGKRIYQTGNKIEHSQDDK